MSDSTTLSTRDLLNTGLCNYTDHWIKFCDYWRKYFLFLENNKIITTMDLLYLNKFVNDSQKSLTVEKYDECINVFKYKCKELLQNIFNTICKESPQDVKDYWFNQAQLNSFNGGFGYSFTFKNAPCHWVMRDKTTFPDIKTHLACLLLDFDYDIRPVAREEVWGN